MSRALADYVTAYHAAVLAVLDLLATERRLERDDASVTALLAAESAVDEAARALTGAVDALPLEPGRRPAGWDGPAALSGVPDYARARVAKAALRCLSAQYADESAGAAAESEYAEEQLALACRNLVADLDARQQQKGGAS